MKRKAFESLISSKIVLLDGATGTMLQARGMPEGISPEIWCLDQRDMLKELHASYVEAGSDIIYTATFGANALKLPDSRTRPTVREVNRELCRVAREAAKNHVRVAGCLGPLGQLLQPSGPLAVAEAAAVYREQAEGLLEGGADLLVVETQIDLLEARTAIIALRDLGDFPLLISLTYEESGRTLTGTDPVTALQSLSFLGVDAIGLNCGTGPVQALPLLAAQRPWAWLPLLVKANAGLPAVREGKTVFPLSPAEFARATLELAVGGAGLVGGCCGTTPAHVAALREALKNEALRPPIGKPAGALTSRTRTLFLPAADHTVLAGERINPTGKKRLAAELRAGRLDEAKRLAREQVDQGAEALDLNLGAPGAPQQELARAMAQFAAGQLEVPLLIDAVDPAVVEAFLAHYPGRALINSISGEEDKMRALLPLAKKYGAMYLLLPLDGQGLPATAAARAAIADRVLTEAARHGLPAISAIVDGLALAVATGLHDPQEILAFLRLVRERWNLPTILGLSNISFGLPRRDLVNGAFLAMAVAAGLSAVIAHPGDEILRGLLAASDLLAGRDRGARRFLAQAGDGKTAPGPVRPAAPSSATASPVTARLHSAVLEGDDHLVGPLLEEALAGGAPPLELVHRWLVPAISEAGEKFAAGHFFLPQLLASATAMERAMQYLAPRLQAAAEDRPGPTLVMATVQGDIHDLGKNLVTLLLRNHGFRVKDLGKDVPPDRIVQAAREENAALVGLSALMTTTLPALRETISRGRAAGLSARFLVGGAVLSPSAARECGADGYARDAVGAVAEAKRLSRGLP